MINLDSLLHNFLSSGIHVPDRETIRKVKAINVFQMAFVMTAPLLGLFYFYIGAIPLFYITIVAGLLMISAIILLRKTKDLPLAGNYATFILWATLVMITWYTGPVTKDGIVKPTLMLDGGLILLAIYLNGYLWGAVWAFLTLIKSAVMVYLFNDHYPFLNLIPDQISEPYYFGIYLSAFLILFVLSLIYNKQRNDDLTREARKSQALMASKRYLDSILDRFQAPTFILNRYHRVIGWNHACQMLTGISPQEIIGKPVSDVFALDDRGSLADIIIEDPDAVKENYRDAVISQTDSGWFELEMSLPKLKGFERATISVVQVLDGRGKVIGAIQMIGDGKERQLESGIIRRSDFDLPDTTLANPVFKIDAKGMICFWNAACEEIFGYPSSQMIGKSPFILLPEEQGPDFQKTIVDVLEKGASFQDKQWKYYTSDKTPIFVLAQAYPSHSSEDKAPQCVILNTNITDLKIKLMKLEHYAAESKEKLKKLSEEHSLLKKNIATFIRGKDDTRSEK